jgi:hypothetical protein
VSTFAAAAGSTEVVVGHEQEPEQVGRLDQVADRSCTSGAAAATSSSCASLTGESSSPRRTRNGSSRLTNSPARVSGSSPR